MVEEGYTKQKPMPNIAYKSMAYVWLNNPIRRMYEKPDRILRKLGVENQYRILDYGCGSGLYTFPAATIAHKGRIYALDIQPLAIKEIEGKKKRQGQGNIETILTDSNQIPLPDDEVDVIILSRVLRYIKNKTEALKEMNRVMKPTGYLWVQQGNMTNGHIRSTVTSEGLFSFEGKIGSGSKFSKSSKSPPS